VSWVSPQGTSTLWQHYVNDLGFSTKFRHKILCFVDELHWPAGVLLYKFYLIWLHSCTIWLMRSPCLSRFLETHNCMGTSCVPNSVQINMPWATRGCRLRQLRPFMFLVCSSSVKVNFTFQGYNYNIPKICLRCPSCACRWCYQLCPSIYRYHLYVSNLLTTIELCRQAMCTKGYAPEEPKTQGWRGGGQ